MYTLSELFYEVMIYNSSEEADSRGEKDTNIRKRLYARLRHVEEGLPQRFLPSHNPAPSAIYLRCVGNLYAFNCMMSNDLTRMHLSEIGFAIIQSQSHDLLLELPASQPGTTIKELCLNHCRSDIKMAEMFLLHWPFEACLWRHLYLSLQPLSLMLDDPEARQLFTAGSAMVRGGCSSFRICGHLLQATQAYAWAVDTEIPTEALLHYEGCKENMETQDLPLSFALPRQDDAKNLLRGKSKRKKGGSFPEEDLGTLIEMWTFQ